MPDKACFVRLQQLLLSRGFGYVPVSAESPGPDQAVLLARWRWAAHELYGLVRAGQEPVENLLFHADRFMQAVSHLAPRRPLWPAYHVRLIFVADHDPPEALSRTLEEHVGLWPRRARSKTLAWVHAAAGRIHTWGRPEPVLEELLDPAAGDRVAGVDYQAAYAEARAEAARIEAFLSHFRAQGRRTPMTRLLLWSIWAVFLGTLVVGAATGRTTWDQALLAGPDLDTLMFWGANAAAYVHAGQVWRVLTSLFVHIGAVHLLVNSLSLVLVGPVVERYFGRARYLLIFLASGAGGGAAGITCHPEMTAAGASGALFGLVGALATGLAVQRAHLPRRVYRTWTRVLVAVIAVNILLGLLIPFIDNSAHIGGLLTGAALGALAARRPGDRRGLGRLQAAGVALVLAILAGLVAAAVLVDRPAVYDRFHLRHFMARYETFWCEARPRLAEAYRAAWPRDVQSLRRPEGRRRTARRLAQLLPELETIAEALGSSHPVGPSATRLRDACLAFFRSFQACLESYISILTEEAREDLPSMPAPCRQLQRDVEAFDRLLDEFHRRLGTAP